MKTRAPVPGRGVRGTRLKDGETVVEVTVPGNGRREMTWEVRWQAIEPGSYAIRVGTGSVSARVACPDGKAP